MIEKDFPIPFVASQALREKQIQQNYRPVIAVHKWFARRPGTLFRALLLAEFADKPVEEAFYCSNDFQGLHVADPFMGGGTPLLEANRVGCDITGYDINPMSYWIVREELESLDLRAYSESAASLRTHLEDRVGPLYKTKCHTCGQSDADVKYFLWVKTIACANCSNEIDLFPGYLVAENKRHPENVFVCAYCGALHGADDRNAPGHCGSCSKKICILGPAKRNRCNCPRCGHTNVYPAAQAGPPTHRLFALEYHCTRCRKSTSGRFFKSPDTEDLLRMEKAVRAIASDHQEFVPDDRIPAGDETSRLHRWGYQHYHEMFNARQLLGLSLSAQYIATVKDERIRQALATNLSDLLRYQNMLCRYDSMALKSLDIFSVHGFPVGLIQCESNLMGIVDPSKRISVGSGGWSNIIDKYAKAKSYCTEPFEILHTGGKKRVVPIRGEWIGDRFNGNGRSSKRTIKLHCGNAAAGEWPARSFDAVLTDPPYLGNVQYAELMDFCYVWLRKLSNNTLIIFSNTSTRNADELTKNDSMGRTIEHFTEGLSAIFLKIAKSLKKGGPLAFTYHHNDTQAYMPVAVALLDSGLVCSATLPCPAEMGASIHINGTGSSIIDSVFIARTTGTVPRRWIADTTQDVAQLVMHDLESLAPVHKPTRGDIRCIINGHMTRLAVWHLRKGWKSRASTGAKLAKVAGWIENLGGVAAVEACLPQSAISREPIGPHEPSLFAESRFQYGEDEIVVSF